MCDTCYKINGNLADQNGNLPRYIKMTPTSTTTWTRQLMYEEHELDEDIHGHCQLKTLSVE